MLLFGTLYALTQLSLTKRAKGYISAQMCIKNIIIHLPIAGVSLGVLINYIYYVNCNIFLIILFFTLCILLIIFSWMLYLLSGI